MGEDTIRDGDKPIDHSVASSKTQWVYYEDWRDIRNEDMGRTGWHSACAAHGATHNERGRRRCRLRRNFASTEETVEVPRRRESLALGRQQVFAHGREGLGGEEDGARLLLAQVLKLEAQEQKNGRCPAIWLKRFPYEAVCQY